MIANISRYTILVILPQNYKISLNLQNNNALQDTLYCIFPYYNKEPCRTSFLSPQKIFLKNRQKRLAESKESFNFAADNHNSITK